MSKDSQAIKLFSNSLPILNEQQIDYFMGIILTKIKKIHLNSDERIRIARLCNNYLKNCLDRNINLSNIKNVYEYLNNLNDPEFLIYKMLGRRDYYLLINNTQEANKITQILKYFGYNF